MIGKRRKITNSYPFNNPASYKKGEGLKSNFLTLSALAYER
jgi:hypothetical protein